jgi:hypothetical protein
LRYHLFDLLTSLVVTCWVILASYWTYPAMGVKKQFPLSATSRAHTLAEAGGAGKIIEDA